MSTSQEPQRLGDLSIFELKLISMARLMQTDPEIGEKVGDEMLRVLHYGTEHEALRVLYLIADSCPDIARPGPEEQE